MIVYAAAAFVALGGFLMLSVDWGRVQVAKTELMNAATASSRAALVDMAQGKTTATNAAISYAARNNVDGIPLVLTNADVTVGTWDATAKTFAAGTTSPNAVSIHAVRSTARGTSIPMLFGAILGVSKCDISCNVIASNARDVQVDLSSYFNAIGFVADGTTYAWYGGIDNSGYAFSKTQLGTSVARGGSTYVLGTATNNVVMCVGQTITLPPGRYKSVVLIVGQGFGPVVSSFVLMNGDGSQTTVWQKVSDWCTADASTVNENICATLDYRNLSNGGRHTMPCYILSYELPITTTSGVVGITLPTMTNLKILAIGLTPAETITVR